MTSVFPSWSALDLFQQEDTKYGPYDIDTLIYYGEITAANFKEHEHLFVKGPFSSAEFHDFFDFLSDYTSGLAETERVWAENLRAMNA